MIDFDHNAFLHSFINYEHRLGGPVDARAFRIDRMRALLAALGDPQKGCRVVHIAGTKGKGSVAAFTAYILRAAGYSVGLYTSPHLETWHERIRVLDGNIDKHDPLAGAISDDDLWSLVRENKTLVESVRDHEDLGELTFFEVFTALALKYFAGRGVDVMVLETGLGGRLDATNAVDAEVCAITPIGLEHTAILGDTAVAIAAEKAGIIKRGVRHVVIGRQSSDVLGVLLDRCAQFHIQPTVIENDMTIRPVKTELHRQVFEVEGINALHGNLQTRLLGAHQRDNAAMAVDIAEWLSDHGLTVDDVAIERGIADAMWPARFEILPGKPIAILDSAHTTDSVRSLISTYTSVFKDKPAVVVFGCLTDKDAVGMGQLWRDTGFEIVLTVPEHPRVQTFENKALLLAFGPRVHVVPNVAKAFKLACDVAEETHATIMICGSISLAAQIRRILCTSTKE